MKKIISAIAIILIIASMCICFAGCSSSSSSSRSSKKSGFYGSDGEYHEYVPEYGDDVNNWMAENW